MGPFFSFLVVEGGGVYVHDVFLLASEAVPLSDKKARYPSDPDSSFFPLSLLLASSFPSSPNKNLALSLFAFFCSSSV